MVVNYWFIDILNIYAKKYIVTILLSYCTVSVISTLAHVTPAVILIVFSTLCIMLIISP